MPDFIGKSFGRYHILEQIGEGGMASVYKAYDTRLERDVAIKILRTGNLAPSMLERTLKRFEREAKTLARLSHPNIVKILDYGEFEGSPYLVMEYLPGGTLKQKLGKPIPYSEAIPILLPVIRALGYAHSMGIIHRDVKPSNILFTESGEPMLSDFGIVKIFATEDSIDITGTGMGIGTPEYMSPEQWTGSATTQSDIYSLGIVLYDMLTGRKPYTADSPAALLLKQANEPLPRPKSFVPTLPDAVEMVLLKALAKRSEDRYQNTNGFALALENCLVSYTAGTLEAKAVDSQKNVTTTAEKTETELKEKNQRGNWKSRLTSFIKIVLRRKEDVKSIPEINKQYIESWKESGTMTVNMLAALEPHRQRRILTLINRDHELRIKDVLVHFGGGRYLLHGFGRFGASALIDQIVTHAQLDLQNLESKNGQGIVMVIRVELDESSDQTKALVALVREFRFEASRGKYAQSIIKRLDKLQKNNFTRVSESTVENTVSIKATPIPGLETSFSRKSDKTLNPINDSLTESGVIEVISQFLDRSEGKKASLLENLVEKILNSTRIPARIIIVLDKISSETTFHALQSLRIFSDERITIFAIVRHENYIKWQGSTLNFINNIGFREYYVPCIWEEDHHLVRDMVKESANLENLDEKVEEFIDYVAYKTRGAPGDVVKELVDPMCNTYEHGVPHLSLDLIRDKKIISVNAWRQRFLKDNWNTILGDDFITLENSDRAKIGVYEIVDWMAQQVEFRLEDVQQSLSQFRASVSPSTALRRDVINRLLDCMLIHGLLLNNQDMYRVVNKPSYKDWTKENWIKDNWTLDS